MLLANEVPQLLQNTIISPVVAFHDTWLFGEQLFKGYPIIRHPIIVIAQKCLLPIEEMGACHASVRNKRRSVVIDFQV